MVRIIFRNLSGENGWQEKTEFRVNRRGAEDAKFRRGLNDPVLFR